MLNSDCISKLQNAAKCDAAVSWFILMFVYSHCCLLLWPMACFTVYQNCDLSIKKNFAWYSTLEIAVLSSVRILDQRLLLQLLHPFNGFFQDTQVSQHQKGKPFWSKRQWGGSGISWTMRKSFAPRSRQITTPVPHHSVFTGRIPFLPPNQQRQSTEGTVPVFNVHLGYDSYLYHWART